jgi:hypothetical protein
MRQRCHERGPDLSASRRESPYGCVSPITPRTAKCSWITRATACGTHLRPDSSAPARALQRDRSS